METLLPKSDRNLDHMLKDETLYDYMKSLLQFNIMSSHQCINHYMLYKDGLVKGSSLMVSYNDPTGKREFQQDLLMNTVIPSEWNDIELRE